VSFETDSKSSRSPATRQVEIWALVRYHYVLISFMVLAGAGLGYLSFLRTPPTFESRSQIFVRNDSKNASIPFQTAEGTTSQMTRETPHAALIITPLIIEKALTKEVALGNSDSEKKKLCEIPFFSQMVSPLSYIAPRLSARPSMAGGTENREIIDLAFRSSDALTSKLVLDAIIESYKDFLGESQKTGSQEVYELIENARNSILNHLSAVDQEYAEFRRDMPLLQDIKGNTQLVNIHKLRMSEIETERAKLLIVANQRRAELESIQAAIRSGGSHESIALMLKSIKQQNGVGDSELNSPASEIFRQIVEHQLLLEDLGQDHPRVRSLQKKIDLMRDFYEGGSPTEGGKKRSGREDFVKVCLDALRYEINSIDAKIQQLDMMFEDESASAKAISSFESKNEYYLKELSRTDALYQRIVKRLDEINIIRDFGGYKTNVISPPRMGGQTAPVFKQCLLVGALCGAAVGFGLAYLAEANDRTFHSPEEVSSQLGLPVVGHVAVIEHNRSEVSSATKLDKMLVTVFNPKSNVAESYRGVRSSLYFSTRGEQHRIIQVTSPNPGDGKSTLCGNLAVSIAQSGKRVIIIDADFRRPKIHDLFGLDKSVGISSVISGDTELPDAIQATEVANLWALPCGPRPNNPSELLTSRRFEELINVLREQYDFVMIDTPPLLAVTDPGVVAARVDGVLLAIRLSKRTRREAIRATEILTSVGANTLGIVINGGADHSGRGFGRYSGYNYGVYQYRYGYQYAYAYEEHDSEDSAEPTQPVSRRRRRQRS
jgi:polysaccharide biosynthesis transport protein